MAGAYYWHRFFSHQPDLNYDNPEVRSTMLRVVDKWLAMGVDGVRLDAVPYLFEREGTNCENLPETHDFLKQLRAHVDEKFPDRMLLAEANQWPEDAVAYFGDGDECHTAFHFPLMPRLFMALRMEDRYPVIDILQQTPEIPDSAQWAIFLRNHDELTLEMVTDEERDYMYRAYAADPQTRVNVGIRRRLAPLHAERPAQDRADERSAVRPPGHAGHLLRRRARHGRQRLPRRPRRRAHADAVESRPQRRVLDRQPPAAVPAGDHRPRVPLRDGQRRGPVEQPQLAAVVDAAAASRSAPSTGCSGAATIEFLFPENAKVLAFVRRDDDETILVVANLSRFATAVDLDLHEYRGAVPMELFGHTEFATIQDGPYQLTLGPHGFYWFALESQRADSGPAVRDGHDLPTITLSGDWRGLMRGRARTSVEQALPKFLAVNRWYAGKARSIRGVETLDVVPVTGRRSRSQAFLMLLQLEYADGEPETYVLPLAVSSAERAEELLVDHPNCGVAWVDVRGGAERLLLHDAVVDPAFLEGTLDAFRRRRSFTSLGGGELRTSTYAGLRRTLADTAPEDLSVQLLGAEQSNSSAVFGNRLVMKMFRRAQEGVNPDLEIGRYLTEVAAFEHTAPLLGALEYVKGRRSEPRTVAVLSAYVPNEGDAWNYTLDQLGLFYETALQTIPDELADLPSWGASPEELWENPPDPVADAIGPYLDSAELLGLRTAELHRALAAGTDEAFRPEPFTSLYQRSVYQSMRSQVRPTLSLLRRALGDLDGAARPLAEVLLDREADVLQRFSAVRSHRIDTARIRVHGDYHLGQVLHAGREFVIIDFEGEPSRSPTERRIKRGALTDVAGMMRSFQYAVAAGLRSLEERGLVPVEQRDELARRGRLWQHWVSRQFLKGYLAGAEGGGFVPADVGDVETLLTAYTLDKALYEIRYELNNRPSWVEIPLRGAVELLAHDRVGSE